MKAKLRENWHTPDPKDPDYTGILLFIFSSKGIQDILSNVEVCYDSPFEKL